VRDTRAETHTHLEDDGEAARAYHQQRLALVAPEGAAARGEEGSGTRVVVRVHVRDPQALDVREQLQHLLAAVAQVQLAQRALAAVHQQPAALEDVEVDGADVAVLGRDGGS